MDGSQPFDPGSIPGWRTLLKITTYASMAEWSKALDLSSSIRKNAWVRTPLEALFCLQGPKQFTHPSSWPNWIRRETTNLEIEGSSPSEDVSYSCTRGLVGYDDCLTRSRSPVRSRAGV